ncbi:MAG: GNAT family N-acetyltransferase [Coprobacillaceae bacterium]
MEIKEIKESKEIQILAELAKEIWEEHFIPIIGEQQVAYMLDKFQSVPAITEQFKDGYQYYLLKDNKITMGYTGIKMEEEKMFLSKLYISKEHRGKGISKKAMQFLIELCKDKDKKAMYLTCNKYNENTLKVYNHLGFKIVKEEITDIGNGYIMDDYILEKEI